jgi:hypothetical protein
MESLFSYSMPTELNFYRLSSHACLLAIQLFLAIFPENEALRAGFLTL